MAGMKFLNLKGWHPSNARNQKRIWIAEQKAKAKEQSEREAADQVRKHAEAQQFQAMAGDVAKCEQLQVGFLYAPPPGLEKVDESVEQHMTEDDAVREFRRKMAKRSGVADQAEDVQRPLERYVGRRPDEMLTIKDQVERFPFLKDAPVEGDYASNVKVNFKPMGRTLRNVKCMRCGEWGHASGDRECALRDANPHDAARQAREDPMAIMAQLKRDSQLVLKQRALPREMQRQEGSGKPEYEILLSDEEAEDPEKAFLAGLSTKEKKALLRKLRRQSKKEPREQSENESSSDSDSSADRTKRKRRKKDKKAKRDMKRRHRSDHRTSNEESKRRGHDDELRSADRKRRRVERSRSRSRARDSGAHAKSGHR